MYVYELKALYDKWAQTLAAGADAPRRHGPRRIRPERDHRISGILISPIGSKTDASLQTSPQAGAAIP